MLNNRLLLSLLVGAFLCLLLLIPMTVTFVKEQVQAEDEAISQSQAKIRNASEKMNNELKKIIPVVEEMAAEISLKNTSEAQQLTRMQQILDGNEDLLEVGKAQVPQEESGVISLHAPHYGYKEGRKQYFQVEESYDYSQADWYLDTVRGGAHWIEPYFGGATRTLVTGYAVPYHEIPGQVTGVFRANLSLVTINKLLMEQQLGKTGYGFLLSKKGIVIAHPKPEYTNGHFSLDKLAQQESNSAYQSLNKALKNTKSGYLEYNNSTTGQVSWLFYEEIPSTEWVLVDNVVKKEVLASYQRNNHSTKIILLSGWVLFLILFILLIRCVAKHRHGRGYEWSASVTCSVVLILAIGILWQLIDVSSQVENTVLVDRIGIARVINDIDNTAKQYNINSPYYLPTGVFIQSLEFSSANNVTMTGYVWQKYDLEKHKDLSRGVVFPEAVSTSFNEAYRSKTERYELVGWYFETVVRQPFDYTYYPFDHKDVWLRIWHKDIGQLTVLVPDMDAYHFINPSEKPGVEGSDSFVLNGWSVINSFFEYKEHAYNSDLGLGYEAGIPNFPELYFTINLERNFIDAFITNLVPLIVVIFMLLATLITVSHDDEEAERFGSNPFAILGGCSALFFIVLVAHIQLRQEIAISEIMYLEYFYFYMYLAILWVSISAFLVVSDVKYFFIRCEDGLMLKIYFLPVLLSSIFITTIMVFY